MKDIKRKMNIAAIIPARGGSKGIPNKNIVSLCDHPLISWSIHQAKLSKKITSVWVTSDDSEILDISKRYGANIITRPSKISTDKSSSESAWIHAIEHLEKFNNFPEIIIGMQATSPIRDYQDLDNAINSFINHKYDSLLTVGEIEDYFIWKLDNNKKLNPHNHDMDDRKPRQEIEKSYLENGSFYIFKPQLIRKNKNRLSGKIGMYLMEKYKSFQIDNEEDLKICSAIMKEYNFKQNYN